MSQPAETDRDKLVIFLHMPKAGGSTMHHILDWNYDHVRLISLYKNIPALLALPDHKKRQLDCLKGQVFYGIHRYFPQECTYITLLRQPVDRVISQYYYNFARKRRLGQPIHDVDIAQFLEIAPFHTSYQLRLLVGGDTIDDVLHQPLPGNAVEIAKQNLARHFSVAGVMDYYDETLLLMKRALGWSRAFYARQNVNPERTPRSDIPAETIALLERECAAEIELYEYVKAQTEALIDRQDDDFHRELARLRRANTRFEWLWHLAGPLRYTPLWNVAKRIARRVSHR